MNIREERIFYWLPRILSILFIGFISLFALDVFMMGGSWWMLLEGFLIHLIPSFVLLLLLLIAWRNERFGGATFIFLAVVFTLFFKTYSEILLFFLISFPVFVIGVLFLLHNRISHH